MSGAQAIEIARSWIGTPYVHQASRKGAGCDCLGLLRGVWRELYGHEPEMPPPYTPGWDEVSGREVLRAAALRHMTETTLAAAQPGDVILFRMRRGAVAKHLGLLSSIGAAPRFIHAFSGHGVVESPLSAPWIARIDGVFALPPHPTDHTKTGD